MRYGFLLIILMILAVPVSSQQYNNKHPISFSLGMGVNYGSSPKFTEYLRAEIPYSNTDSISYYNGGVEFFGGLDYGISRNFTVRLDYSYLLRSASYNYSFYVFDYTINSHQPYIFANYVYRSAKLNLRFGLGAGYHFQNVTNRISSVTEKKYNSSGFGLRGEGAYHLTLSKKVYGIFTVIGYTNFYSDLKDENDQILQSSSGSKTANLSGYGIGLRLGFGFIIN